MATPVRALVVLTTVGGEEEANQLAAAIVERRHAACVNIVPGIRSIYRWQGDVRRDSEWLLIIKTLDSEYAALEAAIRELHSYETPEIMALSVERGDERYLEWLRAAVSAPRS